VVDGVFSDAEVTGDGFSTSEDFTAAFNH
jgi:hypothetical protein